MTVASSYLMDLSQRIADLAQNPALIEAADAVERTARADALVYIFGTGHSHMLAEEALYRAGGLALTVPILTATTMLHEGAVAGSTFERMSGIVGPIFDRYPIGPQDVLLVVSNSGVNAAPVEAAEIGRARGATVIAITSLDYSRAIANGRKRLADFAHIVLDNGAPPGDATMPVGDAGLRAGPVSTSIGAALMNAVFVEVAGRLAALGDTSAIYLSSNMPGATAHNERLVAKYRGRNPHL